MAEMTDVVEAMVRAILEARLWPGAWIKANEAEMNAARFEARAAIRACRDAGGLVVRKMPGDMDVSVLNEAGILHAVGHNAALAAVRAAAVEVE